ncbi:uncharacterized protein LOC111309792 [Durio zibethinus]|uniref:Uncharacterized protein LOC111309792 n=1 Tax=Durio zibethinus TaxID=66656 RepID=A0A6P6AI14_DURZI|nr:uncharacterized protein LOC111309792 [Durio zibethinus]
MVKEEGESSSSRDEKQRSPLTIATLQIIKEQPRRRGKRKQPGGSIMHFDNTDPGYGWLLPGWIAEERRVLSGRLYRYYYDPSGRQYRTQREVLYAWERSGVVCIDF